MKKALCALNIPMIFIEFFYSFCVGNSPEARRDLNIATEILLANVTGESTLC